MAVRNGSRLQEITRTVDLFFQPVNPADNLESLSAILDDHVELNNHQSPSKTESNSAHHCYLDGKPYLLRKLEHLFFVLRGERHTFDP